MVSFFDGGVHRDRRPYCVRRHDSRVGGILVCGALMAGATVTGAARVMADAHYASDVLVGAAIGLISGLLVPWLHYGGGWRSPELGSLRLLPAPVAVPSGGGMGVVGIF